MSNILSDTCAFCDKMGLPVMPVRYAIAPDTAKAPKIAAPFAVTDQDGKAIPIGGQAHYTTRLLRSGYLYVYDEARKRWSAYYVTEDAYYLHFDMEKPMPAAYVGRVPCIRNGHPEVASMITISDPKNATTVWFGFSDVEWTPAVRTLHESEDYRKRHMQMLDVKKALAGSPQPHAQKIAKLGDTVAEYALDPFHGKKTFEGTPFTFCPREPQLKQMIDKADALRKDKGVVLALSDPAGVATELAVLMQSRMAAFMSRPAIQRPLKAAGTIAGLEESIKSSAKAAAALGVERYADMIEEGPAAYNPNAMLAGVTGDPEEAQKLRAMITPEALKNVADKEWRQYTHHLNRAGQPARFDDAARTTWQAQFDADLETFDRTQIAPLARSHVAWMRSDCMADYFACNFDDKDPKSGVAYAATFRMCIDQTADKKACFDLYEDWLKGDVTDKRNLALRALGLNQEALARQTKESLATGIDWRVLPNDDVFSAFAILLARLPTTAASALGGLLDQLGGVLIKIARGAVNGNAPGLQAMAVMGGAAGRQIARLPVTGSKKKFVEHYVRELSRLGGPNVTEHQLRRAAAAQVRLLGYEGMKLEGSDRRHWLVALDRNVLKDIPPNASGQAWANAAAEAIHSPETLQKADAQAWRSFMGTNVPANLVVGIIQVASLGKLVADYTNAMGHETKEATRRLMAGIAAFAGTLGELTGAALEKMAQRNWSNMRGGLTRVGTMLKVGGKRLGVIAAFVTGALDWMQYEKESANGNKGLARLYFASSILGGVLAIAFLVVKFIPLLIVFVLVAAFVLVTYLIEKNKDNKLQEWLARCYFNVNPSQRYPDFEIEKKELDLALKG